MDFTLFDWSGVSHLSVYPERLAFALVEGIPSVFDKLLNLEWAALPGDFLVQVEVIKFAVLSSVVLETVAF